MKYSKADSTLMRMTKRELIEYVREIKRKGGNYERRKVKRNITKP